MYDKAILVVSFGTSYKETREKTIDKIEEDIEKNYKDYKVYRAFTSKVIIKILKSRDNLYIDTVEEALERIIKDGIKEIIIQPTHIINGIENDSMIKDIEKYKEDFESIRIGSPLLTNTDDYRELVNILKNHFCNIGGDEAIVFMGHGSSHDANAVYPALDYMFKDYGFKNIFVATIDGYPEIDSVLNFLKENKIKKVHLTPLLVVAGSHALKDMASDREDSWKTIFEKEGYEVNCIIKGLGEYEEVRDMFIKHIHEAIDISMHKKEDGI